MFPYLVIWLLLGIKYLSLHCTAFDVGKPLVFLDNALHQVYSSPGSLKERENVIS